MQWGRYFDSLPPHTKATDGTPIKSETKAGGKMDVILEDRKIQNVQIPPGASPEITARIGESIANLPPGIKEARLYDLVNRGGPLDYQRSEGQGFNLIAATAMES